MRKENSKNTTTYYHHNGSTPIADITNLQTGVNSTSSLSYNNGGYNYTGTTSPYNLNGMVTADNSIASADLNVGTSFRGGRYYET